MHINKLERTQTLPITLEEAWSFFSNPANLSTITPDDMSFKITSKPHEGPMYEGQIITYVVKPLLGIPMNWMTEITKVEPLRRFVDSQLVGPYKVWHHEHWFEEVEGGTKMVDLVYYSIPFFPLSVIADKLFVNGKLNHIFDYRFKVIDELFSKKEVPTLSKMSV